jgi:hypothetical protein
MQIVQLASDLPAARARGREDPDGKNGLRRIDLSLRKKLLGFL